MTTPNDALKGRLRRRVRAGRGPVLASLAAACAFCLALLVGRIVYTGRETYSFLAWNLVLAVIPFGLALMVEAAIFSGRRMLLPLVVFAWMLFLPNAPYMVTDFVHLEHDPPVPLWFDVLLFTAYAWIGLLLGLLSIHLLQEQARHRLGAATTSALILVVLGASSIAIYLGRFEELNSWDLLVRPSATLAAVLSPPSLSRLAGFTASFTAFLIVSYACVDALMSSGTLRPTEEGVRGET